MVPRMMVRRVRRAGVLAVVLAFALLVPLSTSAQSPPTSYEARFYIQGAPTPMSTFVFAASAAACSQPAPPGDAATVNPNRLVWDDTANPGQVCQYVAQAGDPLLSFPLGPYEGTLVAINQVGPSPESNRAPFARDAPTAAPTGYRVIRSGS